MGSGVGEAVADLGSDRQDGAERVEPSDGARRRCRAGEKRCMKG